LVDDADEHMHAKGFVLYLAEEPDISRGKSRKSYHTCKQKE